MAKHLPLTDKDGEVRDLTRDDLKRFRPAGEVLPKELAESISKRGRPVSETPKIPVSIRLTADVLDAFKATGKGWQSRMNEALRDWLSEHRP